MTTQAQILKYATTAHNEYKKLATLENKYFTAKSTAHNIEQQMMSYIIKTYGNPFKANTEGDYYVTQTESKLKMLNKKLAAIIKENKIQARKCNDLYDKLYYQSVLDEVIAAEKQKYKTTHVKIEYIPLDEIMGID